MEKWILLGMAPLFLTLIVAEAWYWHRRDPGKYQLADAIATVTTH